MTERITDAPKPTTTSAGYETSEVIVMHTYKLNASKEARSGILKLVGSPYTNVIYESRSDVCYFIIPASDTAIFLSAIAAFNSTCERVSISDVIDRYSTNIGFIFCGNPKLISMLLH